MIDIQNTRAILIGVSEFQDKKHFVDAAPIQNNVLDFKARLMDESILGLPESQILLLNQNETHIQILDEVENFLKQTWGDTLIFYFAGHGYKTRKGDFYLVCNNTSEKHIDITAISWEKIKALFETSGYGIQQRFYILDACHSGAATLGEEDTLDIAQGSALIAAAKANKKSYFDPNDKYTYFTAALLNTLDKGVRNLEKPELSIESIFAKMNLELKDKNFDLQIKTTDRINDVNFFLNKSFDEVALLLKEADDFFENTDYKEAIAKYSEALYICTVNQNQTKATEITKKIKRANDNQKIIDKSRQKDKTSFVKVSNFDKASFKAESEPSPFVKVSKLTKDKTTSQLVKPKDKEDPKPAFDFKKLLIPFLFLIVGLVGWQIWEAMQKPQDNDFETFEKAKLKNTEEAYSNYLKVYPKGEFVLSAKGLIDSLANLTEIETITTTEDVQTENSNKKEEDLWTSVANKNTKDAYEKYLYNYKNGKYARIAKGKIAVFEKAEQAAADKKQEDTRIADANKFKLADKKAYQKALNRNTVQGYSDYINNNSNGKYLTSAKGKRDNLRRVIIPSLPKIAMVHVQGGTFKMGDDGLTFTKPIHTVKLSSFQIGKYEVTQKLWKAVMGTNPSHFKGDNLPVEQVSWNDIQKFLAKLNKITKKKYRLPTEAEWEFAAREGNKSQNYKYSGSNTIGNVAEYNGNNKKSTKNVGGKSPNELGIYDMSGNVWEWCSDWYGTYPSSNQTNPKGAASGSDRVYRGGSWNSHVSFCHVAFRYPGSPSNRLNNLGFRMVLVP